MGGLGATGGIEMNLKSISLLLLPTLLALLLACGAGSQIADTRVPETKVLAKVEVAPEFQKEASERVAAALWPGA